MFFSKPNATMLYNQIRMIKHTQCSNYFKYCGFPAHTRTFTIALCRTEAEAGLSAPT